MSCASAKARALPLICAALAACQDPARAPLPLTVTSDPAAQTAGGVITLTSDQFSRFTLQPNPDTLRPNRWTNFGVVVGSDTAESWRIGPTQIAFRVPPVRTGNYEASISARGSDRVKMDAPVPSYRANHFIFDLSPVGSAAATVWRADPWTLVDTIPCSNPGGVYTAAELSPTTCLMMHTGTLVRNGTDTLLQNQAPIAFGDFRLSPGGKWAVMRT